MKDSSLKNDGKTRIHPGPMGSTSQPDYVNPVQPSFGDRLVRVGDTLNNRFVLDEFIAAGGMGAVFKATDLRKVEAMDRNPCVAIKVLNKDFREHPESWIALQRETRKSQQLAHPNIITVYDFDRDGSTFYMTMELLEGESLKAFIERMSGCGLSYSKTIFIVEEISKALSYAHKKGIVHSDLHPGNVFLTQDNNVKVLDFGIARAIKKPEQGKSTTVFDPARLGALTPAYASLEIIEGTAPDPRDDIYALACITYELLSGKHPFNRRTALEACAHSLKPKRIEGLNKNQWLSLRKGLALHQRERTPTVEAFFNQLQAPIKKKLMLPILVILGFLVLIPLVYFGYLTLGQRSLENQIAEVESLVDQARLSGDHAETAASRLQQLIASNPNNPRLEQLRDDIAVAYLNLAKVAEKSRNLEAATDYLRLGREQTENRRGIGVLDAYVRDLKNQRKTIASLEQSIERGLEEMSIAVGGIDSMLSALDQLSHLEPSHPLIGRGKQHIEQRTIQAANQYAERKQWLKGLKLVEEVQLALPESTALLATHKELTEGHQKRLNHAKETEVQRLAEIGKRKTQIEQILNVSPLTAKRIKTLNQELVQLEKLLPANDPWLVQSYATLHSIEEKQDRKPAEMPKWNISPMGAEKTD